MTIEQNGPGNVSASYGKRTTSNKFDASKAYDKDIYINSAGHIVSPGGRFISNAKWADIQSRCATRLYSTMLSNTTSAALAGYGFPGPTVLTHAFLADVEVDFDAISLIVQNSTGSALTWSNLKASSVRQVANFNANITSTVSGTFAGASSLSVAAGSVTNPTLAVSDAIPLSSVPRTDGGTRPLVLFTVETTTAADGSTQIGSWYRGGGNNTTKTHDGGRVLAATTTPGSTAPAALVPAITNPDGTSAIVGFVYWSRGAKVLTVMESGNSLVAGNTLAIANRGHLIRAVEEVSTPSAPVEYMVCGLPGQSITVIRALTEKIIGIGALGNGLKPGLTIFNPFDTNANVGSNIDLAPMRHAASRIESVIQNSGGSLLLTEGLPRQSDATTSAWLNDSVRRSFNSSLASDYGVGIIAQATALEKVDQPFLFKTGAVAGDFTHLTQSGDDEVKNLIIEAIQTDFR